MEAVIVIGLIILLLGLVKKAKRIVGLGILVACVAYGLSYMGVLNIMM